MSNEIRSLAVIDTEKRMILPAESDLRSVMEELADMERIPMGRIQIAGGGAGVFNVLEPGAEDADPVREVVGVILMSHACNAYWQGAFGSSDDKNPDCSSMDGDTGIVKGTGEVVACKSCPYNQYGSADGGQGTGKACKNMRRLYVLREGDVLPMVLSLPPSALKAYDMYRTRLTLGMKRCYSVLTRFTLAKAQSSTGITYSTPKFEAIGALPPGESERVRAYAEGMLKSAQKVGITADDYQAANADSAGQAASVTGKPPKGAKPAQAASGGFTQVDTDELPDNW